MRKISIVAATLAATLGLAAPALAQSPLSMSTAHHRADSFMLHSADPVTVLPSYSAATRWDGTNDDPGNCVRWNRMAVSCVVSVDAQDYYYDPVAEMQTGFAYCVATVRVTKNRWGSVRVRFSDFNPSTDCDSTSDYGY